MSTPRKYTNKLTSRRVLVLGGTSGVGFCVAEGALEQGATVIISSSNPAKLAKALARLNPSNQPDLPLTGATCDLGCSPDVLEDNLRALVAFATDDGKHLLDHVVFTAGDAVDRTPIDELTPSRAMKMFPVRFLAPAMLAKVLSGHIRKETSSSVTFTGGVSTDRPGAGWAMGAAVGGAIEGLMRGLAVEMKPVRYNVVSLGGVHTELFGGMEGVVLESFLEKLRAGTLVGEVGRPEDVAEAYLYLMRDRFVTGSVVKTNGGMLLT